MILTDQFFRTQSRSISLIKNGIFITIAVILSACTSKQEIKYPAKLTQEQSAASKTSPLISARSAYDFKDKDIVVPANFEPQGLDNCNFSKNNENDNCPLKKPIIRVYFDGNQSNNQTQETTSHDSEAKALKQLNNEKLGLLFENQLAGLNRFRIVTRDDQTQTEMAVVKTPFHFVLYVYESI